MRSTFKTVFYVNGSKEKNGIVPIMGRVTINGTIAQFSCKQHISKELWDAKGNRAKGKSREAVAVNYALDNIKAQITKHYQRLSDREAFVTAERAGFQVVKDPIDKSKLALAINGQPIGEWFKEQFDRLFSSIRRTVEPLRRGKGMGL